jgi:hypothetical protein
MAALAASCGSGSAPGVKVGDAVFVQPYTISYGQPYNGGSSWAQAQVTAVSGDTVTIKPGPHWNDIASYLTEPSYKIKMEYVVKQIPLGKNEVKLNAPVLVRRGFWDTTFVYIENGTIAKIEGDSISVAFLMDQKPETTKVELNYLWKYNP